MQAKDVIASLADIREPIVRWSIGSPKEARDGVFHRAVASRLFAVSAVVALVDEDFHCERLLL